MIDVTFTSKLRKARGKGGWTYAVWPDASDFFGTKGLVKIRGTVEGYPIETSFMAMGNGMQMLPIKADARKAINKEAADTVTVHLTEHLS